MQDNRSQYFTKDGKYSPRKSEQIRAARVNNPKPPKKDFAAIWQAIKDDCQKLQRGEITINHF